MKRIILGLVLLLLAAPAWGRATGKVLLVEVKAPLATAPVPSIVLDYNLRMRAAIMQSLYKRGIRHEDYDWATGNVDTLKARLTSGDFNFAIIYGGVSNQPDQATADRNIKNFWGTDSTYCNTPALVWYAVDCRPGTSSNAYVNGGINTGTTDRWVQATDTFLVVRDYAAIDSFFYSKQSTNVSNYGVKRDTTITGKTVTPIIEKVNSTARFMAFWKVTWGTNVKYYLGLRDPNGIGLVDALLCKYFPDANPVEYCLTIDDFGMVGQTSHPGPTTYYPYPGHANEYPSRFFSEQLPAFFDLIRAYDSKLTIGTSMMNLRKYSADSSQWSGWKTLYDDKIGPHYGKNFSMVWHDHGENHPADSIQLTFQHIGAFNDWEAKTGRRKSVHTNDLDSLYQVWQDTMTSYGFKYDNAIIPPADRQMSYYGVTPLDAAFGNRFADTLITFCGDWNMPMRGLYNRNASIVRYPATAKYREAKVLHEFYAPGADSTNATSAEKVTYMLQTHGAILSLNLYDAYDATNNYYTKFFKQGSGGSNRSFPNGYYSGRTTPVIVFHTGRLLKKGAGTTADYQVCEQLLKHLAFFDEIAGRQIYKPVFLHEFAERDHWDLLVAP